MRDMSDSQFPGWFNHAFGNNKIMTLESPVLLNLTRYNNFPWYSASVSACTGGSVYSAAVTPHS